MNTSPEAETLTNSLLTTIRLQRHLAARVIISTQEPTISSQLLDLCSVTIVHRFTSPDWLRVLRRHIAGASLVDSSSEDSDSTAADAEAKKTDDLLSQVVTLRVGEALLFSPSAIARWDDKSAEGGVNIAKKLAAGYIKVQIRSRITEDGGKSVMAN